MIQKHCVFPQFNHKYVWNARIRRLLKFSILRLRQDIECLIFNCPNSVITYIGCSGLLCLFLGFDICIASKMFNSRQSKLRNSS